MNLAVIGLGTPDRLRDALTALVEHESQHDFTVTCVVNAVGPEVAPSTWPMPDGIEVDYPAGNLGWAGGLHRARRLSEAELMVWVQEDMTPEPGWLDALVAAADAHPQIGGFGSVRVGDDGGVLLYNAGRAEPAREVAAWNLTDRTPADLPDEVTVFDWVTSKGLLTRTAAFDEISGPDPRLWPLNHVDKDYCTHLRCHGWDVALVPDARLRHIGSQASPSAFRKFLNAWRDGWFDARWGDTVAALAGNTSARIAHPCAEWRELPADPVELAAGLEASRMVVPYARERAQHEARVAAEHAAQLETAEERRVRAAAAYERADLRAKRRKKRLAVAEARLAELTAQETGQATGLRGRLRRRLRRLR